MLFLASVIATGTSGCFFSDTFVVFSSTGNEGEVNVSMSGNSLVAPCNQNGAFFECLFGSGEGAGILSSLSFTEIALILFFADPLVVQVPASAYGFAGSYSAPGENGSLSIVTGLGTVPVDATRALTAEPGMQFIIVDLPAGATIPASPTNYAFNLNFKLPPGTSSIDVKPMFTGKVDTGSTVYYPPLLPCVDNIGAAPSITIPLPAPGDSVAVPPITSALACSSKVYSLGAAAASAASGVTAIPTGSPWMYAAMAAILVLLAGVRLRGA
jgi:hypothetical protein